MNTYENMYHGIPWIDIIFKLNYRDIGRLSQVNKYFRDICNQSLLWKRLFYRDFSMRTLHYSITYEEALISNDEEYELFTKKDPKREYHRHVCESKSYTWMDISKYLDKDICLLIDCWTDDHKTKIRFTKLDNKSSCDGNCDRVYLISKDNGIGHPVSLCYLHDVLSIKEILESLPSLKGEIWYLLLNEGIYFYRTLPETIMEYWYENYEVIHWDGLMVFRTDNEYVYVNHDESKRSFRSLIC